MQIKVNFLCKDSMLAAPLVLEIARVLDLARQRGEGGAAGAALALLQGADDGAAVRRSTPSMCRSGCCDWLEASWPMSLAAGRRRGGAPPALMPLLRASQDLSGSAPQGGQAPSPRALCRAWAALVAGAHPADVARHSLRQALAATVLGDLDAALLDRLGMPAEAARASRRATVAERGRAGRSGIAGLARGGT
jgi:hypothetical protein